MAKLSFSTGEGEEEKSYRLLASRPLRIGRDPSNDVILRDAKVSRAHAEVTFERGFYVLHDLGSANGTFVSGIRVRVAPLTDGAELRFGNTHARFSEELPEQPSATIAKKLEDQSEVAAPAEVPSGHQPVALPEVPEPIPTTLEAKHPQPAPDEGGNRDTIEAPLPPNEARMALPLVERLRGHRFFIDNPLSRGLLVIRDAAEEPVLFFKPHVTLINLIAKLLAAIIAVTGLAASAFLSVEGRFLPAGAAALLTLLFVAVIVSLAPKRFIHLFADGEATARELSLWEESRLPFPVARFSGRSGDGAIFAFFEKPTVNPLSRRRWWVLDRRRGQRIGYAIEDSLARSLARKALGNFFSALRPNYALYSGMNRCGFLDRRSERSDRVVVDLEEEPSLDRRTALALALLITTIER